MSDELDVAIRAARSAGALLVERFHNAGEVRWKGKRNLVTETDLASEKLIISLLNQAFPSHAVVGEESGQSREAEYTWYIDPLDGTNNYLYGLPFFCVTLALVRNNMPLVGVTYDPMRSELFCCDHSGPPTLNGRKLEVSARDGLDHALIGIDLGYSPPDGDQMLRMLPDLWSHSHGVRLMGSSALALAYVAAGRLDVYCHRWLYPWDIAAGILLIERGGGKVTDWDGQAASPQSRRIVAGGPGMHGAFLDWYQSGGHREAREADANASGDAERKR